MSLGSATSQALDVCLVALGPHACVQFVEDDAQGGHADEEVRVVAALDVALDVLARVAELAHETLPLEDASILTGQGHSVGHALTSCCRNASCPRCSCSTRLSIEYLRTVYARVSTPLVRWGIAADRTSCPLRAPRSCSRRTRPPRRWRPC